MLPSLREPSHSRRSNVSNGSYAPGCGAAGADKTRGTGGATSSCDSPPVLQDRPERYASGDREKMRPKHSGPARQPLPSPRFTRTYAWRMTRDHRTRHHFHGHIAGAGTSGGTRLVLGCWSRTPHGPFADVMVAHPDGRRELLAPDDWVADFVASTYTFDDVRIVPVSVRRSGTGAKSSWRVTAGPLTWEFTVGARHRLGYLLRAVPTPLGRTLTFTRASDVVARLVMPGVRTVGTAGNDRLEWYSARDLHNLTHSAATWDGADLGTLTEMTPPPDFGFSSTPRQPSLTRLTSTVLGDFRPGNNPQNT